MNSYLIPLAKQELLHHMLQVGGAAVCPLQRPEQTIHASFEVELTDTTALINVDLGGHTGELTLKRSDRANHLHLRISSRTSRTAALSRRNPRHQNSSADWRKLIRHWPTRKHCLTAFAN